MLMFKHDFLPFQLESLHLRFMRMCVLVEIWMSETYPTWCWWTCLCWGVSLWRQILGLRVMSHDVNVCFYCYNMCWRCVRQYWIVLLCTWTCICTWLLIIHMSQSFWHLHRTKNGYYKSYVTHMNLMIKCI